jgi:hypothetical protein
VGHSVLDDSIRHVWDSYSRFFVDTNVVERSDIIRQNLYDKARMDHVHPEGFNPIKRLKWDGNEDSRFSWQSLPWGEASRQGTYMHSTHLLKQSSGFKCSRNLRLFSDRAKCLPMRYGKPAIEKGQRFKYGEL